MTEFGGPGGAAAGRARRSPSPRPDEVLIRVSRAGLNFADTHTRTNSYVQKATLPLVPGGEVAGVREDTGERVVALVGNGGYAEYADGARGARVPDPRRARRRHGAGDDHPGHDRLAPVPHRRAGRRRARASWCTAPPAASARWRSSSAIRSAPGA